MGERELLGSPRERVAILYRLRDRLLSECQHAFYRYQRVLGDQSAENLDEATLQCLVYDDAPRRRFLQHLGRRFGNAVGDIAAGASGSRHLAAVDAANPTAPPQLAEVSARLTARHLHALYPLHRRLSVLLGHAAIDETLSPLAPSAIVDALAAAIGPVSLDDAVLALAAQTFDDVFAAELAAVYRSLNDLMIEAGILAHLQLFPTALSASGPTEDNDAAERLIGRIDHWIGHRPSRLAGQRPFAALVEQIADWQADVARAVTAGRAAPEARLDEWLAPLTDPEPPSAVTDPAVLRLQLVDHLFGQLQHRPLLAPPCCQLLRAARPAYLKLAALDAGLLRTARHPAWQLLDRLVYAAERWIEPERASTHGVYRQQQLAVGRLLRDYETDPAPFTDVALHLGAFLRAWERRNRLTEARSLTAMRGEEKLRVTTERVRRHLNHRLAGSDLPTPVTEVLLGPWATSMAFVMMRHGSSSDAWRRASQLVDDVLWLAGPLTDWGELKRARRRRETLLHELRTGLESVCDDPVVVDRSIDTMRAALRLNDAGTRTNPAAADDAIPVITDRADDISTAAADLSAVSPGTWLTLRYDRQPDLQCKFVWRNPATMNYMFVSREGRQAAVIDADTLAARLADDSARIIPEPGARPFVATGLDRAFRELKRIKGTIH